MTLVVAYDGINFDDTFCFIFLTTNVELYFEQKTTLDDPNKSQNN